jgi:hypothetical protein
MNRTLLAAVAAALAILLPAPAFACTPIPPKTWTGNLQVAGGQFSAGYNDFVVNKCAFHDDRLNGLDVVVFDVASHAGLAGAAKWTTSFQTKPDQVNGVFFTAACGVLPGTGFVQATSGANVAFTFPSNAKWLVVSPYTAVPSKDIAITVSSPGRVCPT